MKKIVLSFLVIAMVTISGITAFAAEIPIKKIISLHDSIMILVENGDLYRADSIYSSTKELVETNVVDLFWLKGYTSLSTTYTGYTNDNRIITYVDGYSLAAGRNVGEITEEREGNVKTPLDLEMPSYIDTSNNLKVADKIYMQDVAKIEEGYILTADGTLYSYKDGFWKYDEPDPKFLMSEVKDFTGDVILKTNGDLYLREGENINKMLSNVDNLSTYHKMGWTANRDYYIVDANNDFYHIDYANGKITPEIVLSNIETLLEYEYGLCPIDIYGNFYKYRTVGLDRNKYTQVNTNGQRIGNLAQCGRKEIYFDENNYLLKDFSPVYQIGKIKTILDIDGYVYINESGEAWHSDKNMTTFEKLQLSEKSTVLNINGEECNLENNIKVVDGRTMYPFRECLNLIGVNVYWDGENQIAIGEIPGVKIEFPIGKNEYYINGVRHEMDTAAYIDTSIGRTYIPIRYAAEGLGYTVDWIEGKVENAIKIYK